MKLFKINRRDIFIPVVSLLGISTLYYGVLGPLYWIYARDGYFLGADFSYQLSGIWLIYISVGLIVMSVVWLLMIKQKAIYIEERDISLGFVGLNLSYLILIIGTFSALMVFQAGDNIKTDGFSLIFYQLADFLVSYLLFKFSLGRKLGWGFVFLLILFLFYAMYTGLRYKIAILTGAIIIYFVFSNSVSLKNKIGIMIGGFFTILIFSLLTVARSKFSGVDYEAIKDITLDRFLYGLFAESNAVFGLISAMEIYDEPSYRLGLRPLWEAVEQFIPRYFYPDKSLYEHLTVIAWGIAFTTESELSGTSMPFFMEYYAMYGWFGVIAGSGLFSITVVYLIKMSIKYSISNKQLWISLGLVIIFMCYYYYSRGSIAQISKGFMFILVPYFVMLRLQMVSKFKI